MPGDGSPLSEKGDLTSLAKDIKDVFEEHGFESPAFGVAFTLEEDREKAHWVTNVPREQGVELFMRTGMRMDRLS